MNVTHPYIYKLGVSISQTNMKMQTLIKVEFGLHNISYTRRVTIKLVTGTFNSLFQNTESTTVLEVTVSAETPQQAER